MWPHVYHLPLCGPLPLHWTVCLRLEPERGWNLQWGEERGPQSGGEVKTRFLTCMETHVVVSDRNQMSFRSIIWPHNCVQILHLWSTTLYRSSAIQHSAAVKVYSTTVSIHDSPLYAPCYIYCTHMVYSYEGLSCNWSCDVMWLSCDFLIPVVGTWGWGSGIAWSWQIPWELHRTQQKWALLESPHLSAAGKDMPYVPQWNSKHPTHASAHLLGELVGRNPGHCLTMDVCLIIYALDWQKHLWICTLYMM